MCWKSLFARAPRLGPGRCDHRQHAHHGRDRGSSCTDPGICPWWFCGWLSWCLGCARRCCASEGEPKRGRFARLSFGSFPVSLRLAGLLQGSTPPLFRHRGHKQTARWMRPCSAKRWARPLYTCFPRSRCSWTPLRRRRASTMQRSWA